LKGFANQYSRGCMVIAGVDVDFLHYLFIFLLREALLE
jgi:hypothetical protein